MTSSYTSGWTWGWPRAGWMSISSSTLRAIAIAMLLVSGVAVAQEIGAPSATPITTAECENAWARATAASSCTTTELAAENVPPSDVVNNCAVKANCASVPGGTHDTFSDYHGGPAGVETLLNCSGTLRPTSC